MPREEVLDLHQPIRAEEERMRHRRATVRALLAGFCLLGYWNPSTSAFSQTADPAPPSPPQATRLPAWTVLKPDRTAPSSGPPDEILSLPGTAVKLPRSATEDFFAVPDWRPHDHPPMPPIVRLGDRGRGIFACGTCHLPSGLGHPESARLAGLSADYMKRQLLSFRTGQRSDYTGVMAKFAKSMTIEEIDQSSRYFAELSARPFNRTVETTSVSQSYVTRTYMRLPRSGTESLGDRIVTLPEDEARTKAHDPIAGFVSFVPVGSVAQGRRLATLSSDKGAACTACHGPSLRGTTVAPNIAGMAPLYVARQLHGFKAGGMRDGAESAPMKQIAQVLTDDQMLALAAYVGSLRP